MLRLLFCFSLIFSLVGCSGTSSQRSEYIHSHPLPANFDQEAENHVLFKVSSAQISEEGMQKLDRQVKWLKRYRYINIIIEGHCDERGTREFNLALGSKRANVVKYYLVASGIGDSRISAVSYGKERPVILGSSPEIWRQNRRSVIMLN
jgi:peptidoglycan-associated lipoprotein